MFRLLAATLTAFLWLSPESGFAQPAVAGSPAPSSQSTSQSTAGAVTEPAPVYLLPDAKRTPLRTLPAGTVVSVREIRENWVQITFNDGVLGARTAWIERRFLTIRERAETPPPKATPQKPPAPAPRQVRRPRPPQSPSVRGLIGAAFDKQAASESFAAVTGEDSSFSYGAGVQGANLWRGLFVEAFFERTKLDGERVFVLGDEVFPLGIPLEIEMMPIDLVGGWRETAGRISTYGGAGVSWLTYKETSDFAGSDENLDERYTGWIVLGGVEVELASWVHARGEVRYRRFDDALGAGGASAAFDETQLGGVGAALKIVVGR